MSDRAKMMQFISSQLPDGEGRLVLAHGTSPGNDIIADVMVCGDDLDIQSNCPEWVTDREVYEHLRWQTMPAWEQWARIRTDGEASRAVELKNRLEAHLATTNVAPYRFQKIRQMWTVEFADVVRVFKIHRGFQHYATLLANPNRRVPSMELAGRLDVIACGIATAEEACGQMFQHDKQAVKDYRQTLAKLRQEQEAAKQRGDNEEMRRKADDIAELEKFLWGDGKRTYTRLLRKKLGKRTRQQQIHSSVGQAMRRAITELIAEGMGKCAEFLERYIIPEDGESFTYRPPSPAPEWHL